MSAQRKLQKHVDINNTCDEATGIVQTFKTTYSLADSKQEGILDLKLAKPDPVIKRRKGAVSAKSSTSNVLISITPKNEEIEPSLSTRIQFDIPCQPHFGPKYIAPEPKGARKARQERRKKEQEGRIVCEYDVIRVPSPTIIDTINESVALESPETSKAKVPPQFPSYVASSALYPPPPRNSRLEADKPKSGIFINIQKEKESEQLEEQGLMNKAYRKRKRTPKKKKSEPEEKELEEIMQAIQWYEEGEGFDQGVMMDDISIQTSGGHILGKFGDRLSLASSATSIQKEDFKVYDEVSWCEIPAIGKLVQTLRDAQTEKTVKKYKKGALENHSFTKIKQKVIDDFCFKFVAGNIHQGDITFPKVSRNHQGICMSISAFCYMQVIKPNEWISRNIDEIVETGNNLYLDSIADLHIHGDRKEITIAEVQKHLIIGNKKIKYQISDPVIKGLVRSLDKRIFNLTSGLGIFFTLCSSGILRTDKVNLLIWKSSKKKFCFFDACPRKHNLYQDPNGVAIYVKVYKLKALISILLDRTDLNNVPFNISEIEVIGIMDKNAKEIPPYISEEHAYKSLNDKQAVVQGTFDLGDICFRFTRNKQSLAMSLVALAYSRISCPMTWHKKTVDKILVIGNQLHTLCVESMCNPEINIEHLPAVFTVGPYILEVKLYENLFADYLYKKGTCVLRQNLTDFFEKHSNALLQIGRHNLAVWQQRGFYYCFDPFTRNKEGLKCRKGAACVSMNKDVDTLVATIASNFDDQDAIFYIHALKLLRIQRDYELNKIFPKHLTLHDIPIDVFEKCRVRKSKKKAIDKTMTADFKQKALLKLLIGDEPGPSIYDIQSNLGSLESQMYPDLNLNKIIKAVPKIREPEIDLVVDLDSASLSDTQIEPKKPTLLDPDEDIPIDDLDSYELTEEEKEVQNLGEGEGEGKIKLGVTGEGEGGDQSSLSKFGIAMSQVTSNELDPCFDIKNINTDLTYCYKLLPARELPIFSPTDREIIIEIEEQIEEFKKLNNFKEATESMQILRGRINAIGVCGEDYDLSLVVPYMCIMASAFALETPLHKWDRRSIDFCLKAGLELFKEYEESFTKIEDFKFELEKSNLLCTVKIIFNTYIGDGLFDLFSGQKVLEKFLEMHVFNKEDCGLVMVTHYTAAVFFKRNLFYLFDPYNCNKEGGMQLNEDVGNACLLRFMSLDTLVAHLVDNLSRRVDDNDKDTTVQNFRLLTLAKPTFIKLDVEKEPSYKQPIEEEVRITQSLELKRPHNFKDLPDGSQLVRGYINIGDLGAEIEYMAPYVCIVASAVAEKYSLRTWSTDIVDFILRTGYKLYEKSKFLFQQLAVLNIPKISLGSTDFGIQVYYVFDGTMSLKVLKLALKKVISSEREWAIIFTEMYTCAIMQRNYLIYLFDPFPCNELGLEDGTEGVACVSRFRTIEDTCIRILFNKSKREKPEKVEYTKFVLGVCKATRVFPEKKKRKAHINQKRDVDYQEDEGEAPEEKAVTDSKLHEESDSEEEVPPKNKIGYQNKQGYKVIEASKALPKPAGNAELAQDHFVCLVASLTVISKPIADWDTKTMNKVLEVGGVVFAHADDLSVSKKRTIKNILIGKHFFDIIVKMLTIEDSKKNKNFDMGMKYIMRSRKFCMVQFLEGCYVLYLDIAEDDEAVHLFNPYAHVFKTKKNGKEKNTEDKEKSKENDEETKACWIKFRSFKSLRHFLSSSNNLNRYTFYTFEVTNVTKAPKSLIVSHEIQEYVQQKQMKDEEFGKPFHEHESWLELHQNPWSRIADKKICGEDRSKWYYWDIEYPNDLFLLMGNIHQNSREFKSANRGKQTLCNIVMAIGMAGIYDLKEWNSNVIDTILRSGNEHFLKCAKDIKEKNYELSMDDVLPDCEIYPYQFEIKFEPVVEGTMFINSPKQFNLYKALRYFFDDFYSRAGVICATKGTIKRYVSFAKKEENEYYMFDCQAYGLPMFAERKGTAYILRCTTLARLVHIMVLTLRGGDFYIYETVADNYNPIFYERSNENLYGRYDSDDKVQQDKNKTEDNERGLKPINEDDEGVKKKDKGDESKKMGGKREKGANKEPVAKIESKEEIIQEEPVETKEGPAEIVKELTEIDEEPTVE